MSDKDYAPKFVLDSDGDYRVFYDEIEVGTVLRERGGGTWRALTRSGGVVAVRERTRDGAAFALYCKRFGHPDRPGRR